MTSRKPGRIFWIGTFAVGVFSPGTGKRRINKRMQSLHEDNKNLRRENTSLRERNLELTKDAKYLREELRRVEGLNSWFLLQDEMNDGLAVIHESPFGDTNQPDGHDVETTIPLAAVN